MWPELAFENWKETCATLHMWTQIVGKIRLECSATLNHWWQVPLYVTSRGLTTSPMAYGEGTFEIIFDFCAHRLILLTSDAATDSFALQPMSVADFYREIMARLRGLGIDVTIWTTPVEIPDPIAFDADTVHAAYDREMAHRFWRILVRTHQVLTEFRGRFLGKASPVHFFWGSFDLAVTRFSGRIAPPHPGAPNIALSVMREAYSHEVSSCGIWPGNGGLGQAAFYAYAYPQPEGFAEAQVSPRSAHFDANMGEFILPYNVARQAIHPKAMILDFLQTTYEAAANAAHWDRANLER
jgi:hypothetical protein